MGMYFTQDIESTDDGDIVVSDYGDIKLATPLRTVAQAIDWVILTNKGELLSEPSFGANIQSFYGDDNNAQTHQLMEMNIKEQLRLQGLIDLNDFDLDVIPIETDEAAIMVEVRGSFLDTDNATGAYRKFIDDFDGLFRGYVYPFTSGLITPLS